MIALEEQLTRTQSEIDSLEGRLKHLRSTVALASVQLTLERRRILGPLGYVAKGVWWAFSKLFVIRD